MCDRCPRVVCSSHIILPPGAHVEDAVFVCVACHIGVFPPATPYFVSTYPNSLACTRADTLQQGFYRGPHSALRQPAASWIPALSGPLKFQGKYQTTSRSQVLHDPLLVINFVLASIKPTGSPARVMAELLKGVLGDALSFHEIRFDFSTDKLVAEHARSMKQFVNIARKVFFLSSRYTILTELYYHQARLQARCRLHHQPLAR